MDLRRKLLFAAAAPLLAMAMACGSDGDEADDSASQGSSQPKALALDTAFGTRGIATVPLSANANDRFMAVAVGADGKTYAAGFIADGGDQAMAVARIDASGALDKTFGNGGFAVANAAVGGKTAELARGVVVQSNGKIVIAGPAERDPLGAGDLARDLDIALARFDTSGKLDPTFGKEGIAMIDLGTGRATSATAFGADTAWGIAGLPGDKIAVMGSKLADGADRTDSDFVIFSVTSAGALDTAFGQGGKVVVDLNRGVDTPRGILAQPDGKIVGSGYSSRASDGVVRPVLIRLSAAGVLDTTFGNAGVATAEVLTGGVAESYNIGLQGSDYILAGYGRGADTAEKVDLIVYRFKQDGTWDKTFGTEGVTRLDLAKEDDRARSMTMLPDGRIMAIGSGKRNATDINAMIVVLSKDGKLDSGFGEGGYLLSDLGGPADAWYGVAVAPDKKSVIIAGYKGTDATSGGNDDSVIARIPL